MIELPISGKRRVGGQGDTVFTGKLKMHFHYYSDAE